MVAVVDAADYDAVASFSWYAQRTVLKGRVIWYATRSGGRHDGQQARIYMHRAIMKPPNELVIDHIDGDGLNNQRLNLRACTRRQNVCSQHVCHARSGARGVSYLPQRIARQWMARITVNDKSRYLGYFATKAEAVAAREAAAVEAFGEFA